MPSKIAFLSLPVLITTTIIGLNQASANGSTVIATVLTPLQTPLGNLKISNYKIARSDREMQIASSAGQDPVRAIQNSFWEVLGRDANRDEVEVWRNALRQEPMSYSTIIQRHKTWLFSDSGQNELTPVIQRSYRVAFGRTASANDVQVWKQYAPENRWGYGDIVSEHRQWLVSGTQEATSELKQVIARSYRQAFGREPSQDDLNVWEPEIRAHRYTYAHLIDLHEKWKRGER